MSKCYFRTTRLDDPANKSLKSKVKVVSCKVHRRRPRIQVDKSAAIRKVEAVKKIKATETLHQGISTHEEAGCLEEKPRFPLVKAEGDTKVIKRITASSRRPSHRLELEVKQDDCTRGRTLPGKTIPAVRKPRNPVSERLVGQCSAKR